MRKFACTLVCLFCLFITHAQTNNSLSSFADPAYTKLTSKTNVAPLPPPGEIEYTGSNNICQGSSLILRASAPTGSSFQWRKDGADIPGATAQTYSASATGSYNVIVTSSGNPTEYTAVVVTVNPNPVANFTFTPDGQCGSTPVSFISTSTGDNLTYSWNFGDPNSGNNTSTDQNPTHQFVGNPGNGNQNFTVTLTVTSNGCSNTITKTLSAKQSPDASLNGPSQTTYDGQVYFRRCSGSMSADMNFTNPSSTLGTNTQYRISWGDNTPDFTATSFNAAISHTYSIGTYTLTYSVTGSNGCTKTVNYKVFVGSNPAVGLENPGNTSICTGSSLTFPISGTSSNTPGTIYKVTFNDGTPALTYTHPAPADVSHLFAKTSCGTTSGTYTNSFSATIQASNPCLSSTATVVPIYVSDKPKADFSVSPANAVCVTTTVTLTNTSANSQYVDAGNCIAGKSLWSVTPATGWTISSGSLGNDFGSSDPSLWSGGSNSLNLRFTTPGTYSIKLKTGNPNCGTDEITKTICVNPTPQAAFTLDQQSGCGPLTVKAASTTNPPTCGTNTYRWTVSYSNSSGCTPNTSSYTFINGTNDASANPEFQFVNPGIYTINLTVYGPGATCSAVATSQQVTVRAKPVVSISAPASVCQNGSITPTAAVNNCYSTTTATYQWSFPGGTPASSSLANPGAIIYNTAGTYSITVAVTNECGTTTVNRQITVGSAPNVTVSPNANLCAGSPTGNFTFSSSVSGTTFNWTNNNTAIGLAASGNGNIPSFTAVNNTGAPLVATITVTPVNGCSGSPASFTITVNPKPALPTVASPLTYCLNDGAGPLTANGTNPLVWYTSAALTNGSLTAPVPSTATASTTTYYVTQKSSEGCESSPAALVVTVRPPISGNTIGSDQSICSGATPAALTPQTTISGGSGTYTYQWQMSTDGTNWTTIPNATSASYTPGPLSGTTKFRRVVTSSPCSGNTSNEITITAQGNLSNTEIAEPQTICAGTVPTLLTGQTPTGGSGTYSYAWESSPNGTTWTALNVTTSDYQPPVLATTTYYRRKVLGGACSVYSSAVKITVNPKPTLLAIPNGAYCNGSAVSASNFMSTPATGTTYQWTNDNPAIGLGTSGTGPYATFTATNTTKAPEIANITVTPIFTANGVSCTGSAASYKITVLPSIALNSIPNEVVCKGTPVSSLTPTHDAATFPGATVSYNWTVSGSGISLTNGSDNSIPAYSTVNNGTIDLVATITVTPVYSFEGQSCSGTPVTYTITVKPGAVSQAGPDQTLCAQPTTALQATLQSGSSGTWSETSGHNATITNPSSPTSSVTNLQAGKTYRFVWTVTGFASCPAATDEVIINVLASLTNNIDKTPRTICSGQTLTITGDQPTGGTGTYTYQWQTSPDGNTWNTLPNQIGASLTFTPAQSQYIRRIVASAPCQSESESVYITVQAPVSNNNITANQTLCTGTASAPLQGTVPGGAGGTYQYQWQQSTDGGASWQDIASATGKDFDPGVLSRTTQFRRTVSTDLCSGPQSSTSNTVTITVNPNARAEFNPSNLIGCPPFILDAALMRLQAYPDRNSQYEWYVNGSLLGTGTTFPGYTLTGSGTSVVIKLKTISKFGCQNDEIEQTFSTTQVPQPAFTISPSSGCGPLNVLITNTTPNAASFTYQWDLGNGQTSTAPQPGTITYPANPTFGDTTYTITLSVISGCETLQTSQTVRVQSSPKALFAPSKTVGCSPMTVTFNNTSLGIGNSYTWDFGDGTIINTTGRAAQSHTYNTAVRDTFYAKLVVTNGCGSDSLQYAIVVTPNTIKLDFALNGIEQQGCAPHTVRFINNSQGASSFRWDFGDGNVLSTTRNIDTVAHTYLQSGTYTVRLLASNGCSDTSTVETILVYPKPRAAFSANQYTTCLGDSVRFTNSSDSATSYLWNFGDGASSTLVHPSHVYSTPGNYNVVLKTFRVNPSGTICSDSTTAVLQVVTNRPGSFTTSGGVGSCAPFTISFHNQNKPAASALWNFGDGTSGSGDDIAHTYTQPGNYTVTLTVTTPGGCTYQSSQTVRVLGPSGTLVYTSGLLCNEQSARFEATTANTDTLIWNFGDGTVLKTTQRIIYHTYAQAGTYLPSVTLFNTAGCSYPIQGKDSIKVDKIVAGYTVSQQDFCGSTQVNFTDTTHAYFGKAATTWRFGDGTTASGSAPNHTYTTSGLYTVQMIVVGNSGCADTVTRTIPIVVNSIPSVSITADTIGCTNRGVNFAGQIQSADTVGLVQWTLSNGARSNSNPFTITLPPGVYTATLIVGTSKGCYDTAQHTVRVYPAPAIQASDDATLCLGNSTRLQVSGALQYSWTPLQGLSCTTCPDPVATPLQTTSYVVRGTNSFGCYDEDTVVLQVIQPLQLTVSNDDSICIGQSATLLASGATTYSWSPATDLSSTTAPNPVARPTTTTRYRVVGYDGFNCFTDTAYVLVAVGPFPTVDLGPDLTLATGTLHPLQSVIQNGPIRKWVWSPPTNLSCATCPLPVAEVKKDISYSVIVTNAYGCTATDTLHIKAFCQQAQVFIPNAFSPDADGINDILMVRGSGIVTVKSFRIFNRWGEVIFERSSFPPNDPRYGWDGRVRGVISGPDVFVYTAEVVCENGTPFTYKGNVSVLK